tara:strand:- start:403 stop:711 length:309 start_codon:yes stop_codon:yes gene_type:complete
MKLSRVNTQKKIIINNIFKKTGLPANYLAEIVNELILSLTSNIISQKTFKIKNFGVFNLKKKNKRIGRNPKNKNEHEITERNVVTFKAAENLRKKLNLDVKK